MTTTIKQKLRPPAVPLVAVDPYFSVWSAADRLTDTHTTHWTGKPNGMTGLIRIDGRPWRFMGTMQPDDRNGGAEPDAMEQTGLDVTALSTVYRFEAGGVRLDVTFTTPLLLDDLDALSRPVSYVAIGVSAADGKPHRVEVYLDVTAEWCVNTPDQTVVWSRTPSENGLVVMRIGTEEQPVLQRAGDDVRIDWGHLHLAVSTADTAATAIGSRRIRGQFAETGGLPDGDDRRMPRAAEDDMPVMAAAWSFGEVTDGGQTRYCMLAYDDVYSIEYFGKPADAYWRRNGQPFESMLSEAFSQYAELRGRCDAFDKQLRDEATEAGGTQYADILELAYRQAIAAHKLVTDENGDLLFLSKECFSNGCIGTVDVSYPSIPLFLKCNPELVKGMMRPIFRYAASEAWPFDFAPHDVGCYPKANGQVYGENKLEFQMPIEECGNMLIMAAAVCLAEGKADFAQRNWELLTAWANYLTANGLDPHNQLCTDDFAGHLAHNANLSVKAILGIGSYAILSGMLGLADEEKRYLEEAREMAGQWTAMADAGDHYKLTFDSGGETWSMKYNLVWDKLFGLHLFPGEVLRKEIPYYLQRRNVYGTPLDSRNTYTKSDWLIWCASMAASREEFEAMIAPLWDSLHETASRVPLTDWYDTITGKQINFQNRTVVGGFFIALLKPFA